MKCSRTYILIYILLSTLLFACLRDDERKASFIPDTLVRETEGIAIDKAKFGISEKALYELYPDSLVDLDGNLYNLSSYFNSKKGLNMVYLIDTATINNTKFDQALFDKMDRLKAYFTKTYGEPEYDRDYPKQEKMQNGVAYNAYIWNVGKKKIIVGMALEETKRGNIYYVVANIKQK